jgi:hypothetical protein
VIKNAAVSMSARNYTPVVVARRSDGGCGSVSEAVSDSPRYSLPLRTSIGRVVLPRCRRGDARLSEAGTGAFQRAWPATIGPSKIALTEAPSALSMSDGNDVAHFLPVVLLRKSLATAAAAYATRTRPRVATPAAPARG